MMKFRLFCLCSLLCLSLGCDKDKVSAPDPAGFKAPEPVQAMDASASPGGGKSSAPPQENAPEEKMVDPN